MSRRNVNGLSWIKLSLEVGLEARLEIGLEASLEIGLEASLVSDEHQCDLGK
ncbi:hypothetical protein [Vibrio splendidus]|uniref:hypothetical protein n=1 Tax=Vibrio splendidus TaxID=29497 RepID=UPI001C006875|nr:hypothetical protein [Vibrio splendidus]MBT9242483.1 hypothetical protein [Vibrio splendidus]MDP2617355.1 hypothetical protein [Vibrio splendidus]